MKTIYTIGRDESCDIVIYDETDITSRMHATIRYDNKGKLFLSDHSTNGTYLNSERLVQGVEVQVNRGDVISFANIAVLDWNAIPKKKNYRILWIPIIFLVLAVLGIVGYTLFINKNKHNDTGFNSGSGGTYTPPIEKVERDSVNTTLRYEKGKEVSLPRKKVENDKTTDKSHKHKAKNKENSNSSGTVKSDTVKDTSVVDTTTAPTKDTVKNIVNAIY